MCDIVVKRAVYLSIGQALQQAADALIGHSVFVGWPHLFEALIESVATDEFR